MHNQPQLAGKRFGRRQVLFLPWSMPKVSRCLFKHMRVMFEPKEASKEVSKEFEYLQRCIQSENESDDEGTAPADVSMPNLVDLSVSTPIKQEPECKTEPEVGAINVPSSNAPTGSAMSISLDDTSTNTPVRKRNRSPILAFVDSESTRSVTLGSDTTRSLDTPTPEMPVTDTMPTPMSTSPPAKVRRSLRQLNKS